MTDTLEFKNGYLIIRIKEGDALTTITVNDFIELQKKHPLISENFRVHAIRNLPNEPRSIFYTISQNGNSDVVCYSEESMYRLLDYEEIVECEMTVNIKYELKIESKLVAEQDVFFVLK